MSTKKKLGIGAALACALALGVSGAAFATPITVGGVTWNPASPLDLNIQALNFRESAVSSVNQTLTGYGQIGSINGADSSKFCVGTAGSGCDLNFTFSYTVSSINGDQIEFNAGTISFFVDDTKSFSATDPTTAGIGTPWLTLTGHSGIANGFTGNAELFSSIVGTPINPLTGSTGLGFLDATGGPAAGYFATHTQTDGTAGGFADFTLNSEFLTQILKGCSGTPSTDPTNMCHYPIGGTASLIGATRAVPEPGALGMLGLGVGVLGLFFWRRRKEADDRA